MVVVGGEERMVLGVRLFCGPAGKRVEGLAVAIFFLMADG